MIEVEVKLQASLCIHGVHAEFNKRRFDSWPPSNNSHVQ